METLCLGHQGSHAAQHCICTYMMSLMSNRGPATLHSLCLDTGRHKSTWHTAYSSTVGLLTNKPVSERAGCSRTSFACVLQSCPACAALLLPGLAAQPPQQQQQRHRCLLADVCCLQHTHTHAHTKWQVSNAVSIDRVLVVVHNQVTSTALRRQHTLVRVQTPHPTPL